MFADAMEMLMQYVWHHRLWPLSTIKTVDGRDVRVIDPGTINNGAGPDFFNAKVVIDGELLAGYVEIHERASDWHRHGHDSDPAYDPVILHVVARDDMGIRRWSTGRLIPQVIMPDAEALRQRYLSLVGAPPAELPCQATIAAMNPLHLADWITALGFERLYRKSDHLLDMCERHHGDWEEVAYATIARAMGFGTNNDAFERLALSTPLKYLRRHGDNPMAIEAILMGQAGFLGDEAIADEYSAQLANEYRFLAHKYNLTPLPPGTWRLGRMRPHNYPHRRIASLARFVATNLNIMATLSSVADEHSASAVFDIGVGDYWTDHHRFGATSPRTTTAFSAASCRLLIINAIVPLIHAWATSRNDERLATAAPSILEELAPESNSIVAMFEAAGIKSRDAFTTQAVIQLRREYCEPRKCIYCRIGHRMLSSPTR